jgi:hypothetical protein
VTDNRHFRTRYWTDKIEDLLRLVAAARIAQFLSEHQVPVQQPVHQPVPTMAAATRTAKIAGLNHFIYTVLEVPANDPVPPRGDPDHPITRLILEVGIGSVQSLATFATEQTLLNTNITDTGGTDITGSIPLLLVQKILALSAWLDDQFDPTGCHAEMMALTCDSYDDFVRIDSIDKRKGIKAYAPIIAPAPIVTSTDAGWWENDAWFLQFKNFMNPISVPDMEAEANFCAIDGWTVFLVIFCTAGHEANGGCDFACIFKGVTIIALSRESVSKFLGPRCVDGLQSASLASDQAKRLSYL